MSVLEGPTTDDDGDDAGSSFGNDDAVALCMSSSNCAVRTEIKSIPPPVNDKSDPQEEGREE